MLPDFVEYILKHNYIVEGKTTHPDPLNEFAREFQWLISRLVVSDLNFVSMQEVLEKCGKCNLLLVSGTEQDADEMNGNFL